MNKLDAKLKRFEKKMDKKAKTFKKKLAKIKVRK